MHLTLNLGTHEIRLYPIGETWQATFQWHKPVYIYDWTLRKLAKWAEAAENDADYRSAEATFIYLATGKKGELKR